MSKRVRAQIWIEFFTDLVCLLISNTASYILFHSIFHRILEYPVAEWQGFIVILIFSYVIVFVTFHSKLDIHKRSRANEIFSIIKNSSLTYMTLMVLMILFKSNILESRYMLVSGYMFFTASTGASRYFLKRWITGYFTQSKIASIVGIVTTEDLAEKFTSDIKKDWAVRVTGIALLDSEFSGNDYDSLISENGGVALKQKTRPKEICDVPVIAYDRSFMEWVRSAPLDEVFINLPYKKASDIQDIVEELEDMGITVHLNLPTLDKLLNQSKFNNINCKMYADTPMADFVATEIGTSWLIAKRIVDIVLGLIGSLISIPIILITAIPLLIESPGPLIFKQDRVGRNGRTFKIYKLRSMVANAEELKKELEKDNQMEGHMFKMDDDPRITKVGKFIRKYSIDELPQFFNVLKGDMSLIGTRPPTVDEFNQYESRHKRRLSMRPGITGMWQVSGRSEITDFEEVVRLDCEYIDNWSAWLDTKIFFKTIVVILTHRGAE